MPVLPTVTAVVLVLSVVMGGATRQGYIGDVIVQAAACVLVGVTLWVLCEPERRPRLDPLGKALLIAAGILCLVQVLPVFPGLGVKALGIPQAVGGTLTVSESWWSRISLTPAASWAGLTSALVPVAIFLAVTQCDLAGRVLLWRVVLVVGALSLLLAILQMLQGPGSPLRFFAITNPSNAVGFFANRNHFAAQLYVTLALAGVWITTSGRHLLQRGRLQGLQAVSMGAAVAALLLLTAGLAMTQSRAGMVIAIGMVIGIGAMVVRSSRGESGSDPSRRGARATLLILGAAVLLVVFLGLQQIVGRFQADVVDDLRWPLARATFGAAFSALPFGTGIGSFVRVYGAIEDPAHLTSEYANRAHNDLAEFLLETGVLGAVLVVLFLIWFWRHAVAAWSARPERRNDMNLALQQAATLAIAGLLLHALVDYGLRTTALSALFAFACGLLTRPAPVAVRHRMPAGGGRKKSVRRPSAKGRPPVPVPTGAAPRPAWSGDIEWPSEWKPASPSAPRPRGDGG